MRLVKPFTFTTFLISTLILLIAIDCEGWAQQNSARAAILPAPSPPQTLPSLVSTSAGWKALGRLPARQKLNLAITLKLRNQGELKGLLQDIYNPASPNYRHYLSVEQFTERFGPTPEDHERVLEYARTNGLTVTHTAANRLVVNVSGAVEDVERTFGVKMHVYQHPVEPRTFYAPDMPPSIEEGLPIQGVAGLSTLNLPHPASTPQRLAAHSQGQFVGSGFDGTYIASDLRAAYVPGVTLNGAGQAIGLFEANGYRMSDIQGYFSSMGQSLSVPIVNVLLNGLDGSCGTDCDDTEQALDIDMALALAPNLSAVIVYEGSDPLTIVNQMAADNLAKQLSCSYVFEPDPTDFDQIFLEMAAQGQGFLASSGDGGAYSPPGCSSNCWESLFPADDPNVTAVGGTELITNGAGGAWQSETAWLYSGGGINDYDYAIASYQAPLINGSNQGSPTLRNIPDVAAIASNVYIQANGSPGSAGGTSASAPLWASFLALANQQANGTAVGFLNPKVYVLAQTANYGNDFHDITTGNNFDSYSPDLFSSVAGYDLVTGLGSPNGQNLINALASANTGANFALLSTYPTLTIVQGQQGEAGITLEAINGFSGTVNLSGVVIGAPTGATASLSQTSITPSAGSTLTVSTTSALSSPSLLVAITGTSGGLTQSLYIPVTVLLPNLVETTVTSPPASVQPGGTFSVTDTVENSGQAPAGSSVTQYYLSDTNTTNGIIYLLGGRSVPALAAAATSSGTVTVTVPANIWPSTPYYLLACANNTNTVPGATVSNCLASSTTTIYHVAKTSTSTSLAVTSSGTQVTSVAVGAAVTLTAMVLAGTTPVSPGQVSFCDAAAAHCEDSHLLGTAQLTSSGAATLRFVPGIGAHSYLAVFAGTTGYATSSSGSSALTVTGTHATTTAISESGSVGNYSLTATVTGVSGVMSPSGNVSFLDTSNSGASLGSGLLAPGSSSLGWLNSQTPAAGADPQGIATADFNGDGIPDLAVANRNDGTVTILLGNGDGTFTQKAVIPDIYSAQSMVAADFNGDGIPDLAVTLSGYGSAVILLGKGDGTFTQVPYLLSTGVLPGPLVAGDWNGDGIADLAVANLIGNSISIFLGSGNGTFSPGPIIQLPGAPQGLAVADFNGDGIPDLAAAVASPNNEIVEVILGDGDGNFTVTGQSLTVGSYPAAIVSADFNGDGVPDLAVTIAFTNTLAIFLGNGDGTFQAAAGPATGDYPLSLVSADFNGDGIPDLAVADSGDSTLTVLVGKGDGTFTAVSNDVAPGNSPVSIVAADFNGDGLPDLATANELGNSASVFLTQLKQTAAATVTSLSPSGAGSHLADASYPGDPHYSSSVSTTVSLTGITTPTLTVMPSSSGITTAQSLSVTVTVNGTPTPTGTVTLSSGSYASSATPLAGGSATIIIAAGALAVGSDTLSVSYTPDANSSSIYTPASGSSSVAVTAASPTVSLSAPPTFPSESVGATSPAQSVTVTNTGSANLTLTAIGLTGPFAITPTGTTCSTASPVVASGSCTVAVTFTPTAAGAASGSLSFTDNAPGSPQTLSLSATGQGPGVSLSPESLTFESQLSGTTSTSQSVTLTNTGTAALAITRIAASGDFGETNDCGTSLAAGSKCTISVTFKPTAGGVRSGSISLTDNAPGDVQTLPLAGTGKDFTLTLSSGSSSSATVTPGQAASYELSFSGQGGLSQTINFTCAGAPSQATCSVNPTSAAPDASGSVLITVTVSTTAPSATLGRIRRPPLGPGSEVTLLLLGLLALWASVPAMGGKLPVSRRRRRALAWCGLVLLGLAMVSCGGGGAGQGGVGNSNPGTPAGTYPLVVTGTVDAAANLTHTTTLMLTVD